MDIKDLVITSMKQLITWKELKELCGGMIDCKECSMFRSGHCGKVTTEETLRVCAGLFREYLTERGETSEFPDNITQNMRQLIEWYDMTQFCFGRTSCVDCPYKKKEYCNSASTDDVMIDIANKCSKYLFPIKKKKRRHKAK